MRNVRVYAFEDILKNGKNVLISVSLVSDNDIHEYDIDISGAKDVKLYIYSAPPLMETTWVGFADFYFYNKDKFDPTADKNQ